jgi:transposase-like protein
VTPTSTPLCPFCRSEEVTTTEKSADDNACWQCRACGQVWNPSRLSAFKARP